MALVLADRVKETSTTSGTSDMVLLGASSGYQAFSQVMTGGDTTYYCIVLQSAGEWEVGIGTYQGGSNALTRNTVLASSNNNNPVSFGIGTKDVFITYPAKRSLYGGSSGSLATDVGLNLLTLTNPSAVTFPRFNADNSVSALDAATFRSAIGAGTGSGTVTSVAMTTPTGLSVSGSPITSSGTLALSMTAGYSIPTTSSQTNWDTAYTDRLKWDGGSTGLTASTGRTSLGATTLGSNLFTITNPSAVTFPRFNADNTVSSLTAADFRTAIGAGTGSGTVTSVSGTSPVASSGGATPAISLASGYGDTQNPYASKTANYFLAAPNGAAGVPTFRAMVAADVPTLNQNTTGSAATLTTTRTLWGQNFNGSANVTGALSSVTTLSMSGQLTNTVATGTAPMVVSSTTRVSNLNVATAGTADVATTSTITTSATSSAFKVPFANTTASTTGNYGLLQDSTATFTYNPSTNTLVVGTVSGALSGNATTATTATNVTVTASSTASNFKVPFANTTASTTGNYGLLQDSAAEFTYNPSTNTLTVGTVSGNASSSDTTASLKFSGGGLAGTVSTALDTLPTLTTGMALCISGTTAPYTANFAPVVKQLTSADGSVVITETSPGVWDLAATTPPPAGAGWYTLQSTTLGNLATTIAMPSDWTSAPTGFTGTAYAYASSTDGSGWATGLSGPAWSTAGPTPMWTSNQPYSSSYFNWSLVTDPATVWSIAPTQGFVFTYMQYPPQSSNMNSYDAWGTGGNWSSSYGSSYMQSSGFTSGSNRVFYLVMTITGNQTVTVNGALFGTTLETAYDSWSNYTYVFFKCTDDASVGNILNGMSSAVTWSFPNGYYGHSWYEYT